MAHKDFSAPVGAEGDTPREATTFTLSGVTQDDKKEAWSETFTCLETPPAGVLDRLVSAISHDKMGRRVFDAPSLIAFCDGILIEADEDRFRELVYDKRRVVKIEVLGDMVIWLAEELAGHPTGG